MRWYLGEGAYKVGAIGAADDNQDAPPLPLAHHRPNLLHPSS
jgi:hypothetical protein